MAVAELGVFGGNGFGRRTATAGTVINHVVPPRKRAYSRITTMVYTAAGTAHTLTVLRPLGSTVLSADASASQAVVNVQANPGPAGNALAANDWVIIQRPDGTLVVDTVSSITGTAITLATSLAAAVPAGSQLWMMGVAADTDPRTGAGHPQYSAPASVTTRYSDDLIGVVASIGNNEPLLVQSNNAVAAGTLEQVSYLHSIK
ncbi:hypothetical protein [Tuwongella immobilis]|uniref:Uncharacterized protein n=1 Tax=Tuwongella immobilis TaxID=692036 RepID=A0A6C2YLR1_9BACT|nr:hypothetical protein [Tuwongella immobilis]VIP02169.1 unnamed protein product [Tuwongella immobilis]VTS00594.1 unnamed protein product [Tuwongella immobilis]